MYATYGYTDDRNNYLSSIDYGNKDSVNYTYDDKGRLTTQTYEDGDTEKTENRPLSCSDTVAYTYSDGDWGDLLIAYDGTEIKSDPIGNMTDDGTWEYEWQHGRQLAKMTQKTEDNTGTQWVYTYNADGMRTSRTNGTDTYEYVYAGSELVYMSVNGTPLRFSHAPDGTPMSVVYPGGTYYYVTNLQGDVVAILDEEGTEVVSYTYDAWGNPLSTTGSLADTLGAANPLRYRGYVYDTETELYYLQSRYYNPEMGRFINADGFVATGQGFVGNNMFAYCGNNPVMRIDPTGESFWGFLLVVAACTVILSGCSSPSPPPDYRKDTSMDRNCYTYAFGLDGVKDPGDFSITDEDPSCMDDKPMHTAEEITTFVERDMAALGKPVRVINSPDDILENEYLVVMRTSDIIIPEWGIADYHFVVQLSDGTWADKMGWDSSRWNKIDGAAVAWDRPNINDYYNIGPVYFAVEK